MTALATRAGGRAGSQPRTRSPQRLSEAIVAAKTQPHAPAEPFGGNQSAQGSVGARRREDGYQPEPEGIAS